jgi:2-oxoglutarate dehydrogenase E1 component
MQGHNAAYVEQLYARYATDPNAVDEPGAEFSAAWATMPRMSQAEAQGPSWARADWPPHRRRLTGADRRMAGPRGRGQGSDRQEDQGQGRRGGVEVTDEQMKRAVLDSIRALMLIRAYRIRGHLVADLDPLGMRDQTPHPELDPKSYGFTEPTWTGRSSSTTCWGCRRVDPRDPRHREAHLLRHLRAAIHAHLRPRTGRWLKERIEGYGKEVQLHPRGPPAILNKLVEAEGFEKFLHVKYMGTKRFGLDGGESLIPAMEQIIKRGGALGVKEVVFGMPHRGRLSVLANVMQKPYRAIFNEFQGGSFKPEDVDGSGDVKYHLGASSDREFDGNIGAPVADREPLAPRGGEPRRAGQGPRQAGPDGRHRPHAGPAGAAAWRRGLCRAGRRGRGFGLSGLRGHRTGGTIHIVVNNQIGFTTAPHFSRSSPYPTDIALMVEAPIFHVNGDDPEAVVHAAKVATEFRQKFGKDVVIDIFCYRRFGHNEGDEPMFTNPIMYKKIKTRRPRCSSTPSGWSRTG